MITLFAYVLIALTISFCCSLFKAVLVNISPGCLVELEHNGDARSGIARRLYDDMDRSLAVLSTVKTLSLTFGALIVGSAATGWHGSLPLFVGSFIALVVFFAVVIPKIVGTQFYRSLIPFTVSAVNALVTLAKPLVQLFDRLPNSEKSTPRLRDEMEAMAELGQEAGVLHGDESELVKNMLRFRDLKIIEIMTPRSVMFSLPEFLDSEGYMKNYSETGFSRIPVYAGDDPDDINGFVMKSDILLAHAQQGSTPLAQLKRPLLAVLENESLPRLMSKILEKRCHMAMVVTEYGDIRGIVTLEDMIETLLGREIVDESDEEVDMQQKALKKWAHRLPESA